MNRILQCACLAGLSTALLACDRPAERLSLDTPTMVAGVEAVCTGVGIEARQDPRWGEYTLRAEIVGPSGELLGDSDFHVATAEGDDIVSIHCSGPWALFKLDPGDYMVTAELGTGEEISQAATAPAGSQAGVTLRFAPPETETAALAE